MATSCSLIVVNYHSASLAAEAVRSARTASRGPLQVVIVDNSVDSREANALRSHADVLIIAETNLGYGAAINRGRSKCDGQTLLVCNPDVRFAAESIDLLLAAGADVAGPALFWDDSYTWFLPPSELHTTGEALDAAIASRSKRWQRSRDRRRIRKRLALWSLRENTIVPAISGAVMAIRGSVFDRLGGFDERFHLYFEEIDFLRRLRGEVMYVPSARCRHLYNQSAGRSASAAGEYARSEIEYLNKWSGAPVTGWIKAIEKPFVAPAAQNLFGEIPIAQPNLLVEASPLPSFETAAGHFPTASLVAIPEEVWRCYRGDSLYLRVIDRESATVLGTYVRTKIRA